MISEPIPVPFTWRERQALRWERRKATMRAWLRRRRFYFSVVGFFVVLLVLVLARHMFYNIPSGHAGVVFRRFMGGTQTDVVRDEGFQFVFAWDGLIIYDVRIQQISHTFTIISRDGLEVGVTLSIRCRPRVELLGVLHREVGSDYVNTIVIPEVQALARSTFGSYTPEEMYTTKRSLIEETLQRAVGQVGERYVALDDLLIKEIRLPAPIRSAIENKLIEQQNALAMEFRIKREQDEALRKIIEGEAVAKFNDLVRPGLNDDVLRYRGIEATLKLAESPNAKVVVIGDHNGLPLILDSSHSAAPLLGGAPATNTQNSAIVPAATPDSVSGRSSSGPPPPGPVQTSPAAAPPGR